MSGWFSIKFNNGFIFPHPEPRIINIVHGWTGIYAQFLLWSVLFCVRIMVIAYRSFWGSLYSFFIKQTIF